MTGTPIKVDHQKMAAVVKRLDTLLDDLDSRGTSGSFASLQDAAMLAEAVCSVNQQEMGTFVRQYNEGFGQAADTYRNVCQLLVEIRNAVARTANIHLENDATQASAFAPLRAETWQHAGGHDNPAKGQGGATTTTVEAPGPLGQTPASSGSDTSSV